MTVEVFSRNLHAMGISGGLTQPLDHRVDRRIGLGNRFIEKLSKQSVQTGSPIFRIPTAPDKQVILN